MGNDVNLLIGKTLKSIENINDEELLLVCDDGSAFKFYHMQDCCESVVIHDVLGELSDLIGSPIVSVSEDENSDVWPDDVGNPDYMPHSFTWTRHTISTSAATVTVRWLGESNGYYGESVYFTRTHEPIESET